MIPLLFNPIFINCILDYYLYTNETCQFRILRSFSFPGYHGSLSKKFLLHYTLLCLRKCPSSISLHKLNAICYLLQLPCAFLYIFFFTSSNLSPNLTLGRLQRYPALKMCPICKSFSSKFVVTTFVSFL